MKKFNAKDWMNNPRPVITKDGREVNNLIVFPIKTKYPVYGIIEKDDYVTTWTTEGIAHEDDDGISKMPAMDLYFKPSVTKFYISRYSIQSLLGYAIPEDAHDDTVQVTIEE